LFIFFLLIGQSDTDNHSAWIGLFTLFDDRRTKEMTEGRLKQFQAKFNLLALDV
jgi:hypothetical protein